MSFKNKIKMKFCLFIVVLHAISQIKCASVTITAVADGDKTQKVQDLEKEKTAIYNQLNEAVADTIQTLEKSNDSDAKQGITYMHELLALVDSFNGTELKQKQTTCNGSKECETLPQTNLSKDGRRIAKPAPKPKNLGFDHIKHALVKTGIFKTEDELILKKEEKVKKMMKLQKKLDIWLKLRELEKQKIKQYRLRQLSNRNDGVTEECPRFGESKGKKKKGDTYARKKYPCCRKCCKKSYMGCL